MTSKLTRLTDDELTETLRQATSGYPLPASVEGNLRHAFAELQERRKADSEPAPVEVEGSDELYDVIDDDGNVVLSAISYNEAQTESDGYNGENLYIVRHEAQPVLVVPEEAYSDDCPELYPSQPDAWAAGWNACRAAMLQAGNSPVIPDGYVMVPVDLLSELRDWAHPEIEKYCEMWKGRRDSEFPALRKVIADADALLAAAPQEAKGE